MRPYQSLVYILIAFLVTPSVAFSEETSPGDMDEVQIRKPKLKPSLLSASSLDDIQGALGYETGIRYDFAPSLDTGFWVQGESKGLVATDARANSEGLFAAANLGWFWQHEPQELRLVTNRTSQGTSGRPSREIVYGFGFLLDLSARTRFETDQLFDNYNLTYGPQIGFTPIHRDRFNQLVPFLYLDFHRVEVLQSESFESLGIDEDAFWRVNVAAGWDIDVGTWWFSNVRPLRPVSLGFDVNYYYAFELPEGASEANFDDGLFYAGTLNYNFRALRTGEPPRWTDWFPLAYVKVGHGRLPPVVDEQTTIQVGFVFTWGKSSRDAK